MDSLKELKLIGITYNQIENGVYALILEEVGGQRRLPIVVGYPEAQSIECKLQEVKTPRPLSHDVMVSILQKLNAKLESIFIYRLENGVFAANLNIVNEDGKRVVVDSRSSDAVALAIRMSAPIMTTDELLKTTGFIPEKPKRGEKADKEKKTQFFKSPRPTTGKKMNYHVMSTTALEEELARLVKEEKYEEAALIKEELENRKSSE